MPPKYALGYHQGCYGYYDRDKLTAAAQAYRDNNIPIDGLHIDVDFQNNYRAFTSSDIKFPNPAEMFSELHALGFKCSTNITSLITTNPYDETGGTEASVTAAGGALAEVTSQSALEASTADAWFCDSQVRIAYVKIFDVSPDLTIVATFS